MTLADDIADDGLPKVDVIELATQILEQGSRRETMVSQRELRAIASALLGMNVLLGQAALATALSLQLERKPNDALRKEVVTAVSVLRRGLYDHNYLEARHLADHDWGKEGPRPPR